MTTLDDYFKRSGSFGYAPPARDCMIWVADWVVECGHPDPAAAWRGKYRTRRGAMHLVSAAGGLLKLAEAAMIAHERLAEPDTAESGDVGVVRFAESGWGEGEPSAAIRAGRFWAALTLTGVVIMEAEALAAWSL